MRIHITGASGSGTSTLGAALADELGMTQFDADDFYWMSTEQPFTVKRNPSERAEMLSAALESTPNCILSGSIVAWGSEIEDAFDLIVFLYVDTDTRVERLLARETARFGYADPAFLEWAAQYDTGPSEGRSLAKHRAWLAARTCPIIELIGDLAVQQRVQVVLAFLHNG
jgi:uridine kinase